MSEKIEPALSAEGWLVVYNAGEAAPDVEVGEDVRVYVLDSGLHIAVHEGNAIGLVEHPAKLIALANAALPDSDPRKITRAGINAMLKGAVALDRIPVDTAPSVREWASQLRHLADALASLLPPEKRCTEHLNAVD